MRCLSEIKVAPSRRRSIGLDEDELGRSIGLELSSSYHEAGLPWRGQLGYQHGRDRRNGNARIWKKYPSSRLERDSKTSNLLSEQLSLYPMHVVTLDGYRSPARRLYRRRRRRRYRRRRYQRWI